MIGFTIILGGLSLLVLVLLVSGLPRRRSSSSSSPSPPSVGLIVLGDIGRSPRMLYHAQSFVNNGFKTYIIAYRGSTPPRSLTENEHCHFLYLPEPISWTSKLPKSLFILFAPFKVLLASFNLLSILLFTIPTTPNYLFVQNPPSIPTLPILQLVTFIKRSKLIIDWHNTGYSVLSLRLGSNDHFLVKIAKQIEFIFGKKAFLHLTVTENMKNQLIKNAKLEGKVVTFHDRPPSHFRRLTQFESHELFLRLPILKTISFDHNDSKEEDSSTLFTCSKGTWLRNRPALLVTSTSYTPDEDLSILLKALTIYEQTALSSSSSPTLLPKIVMLVTGKGFGKNSFENQIKSLESSTKLGKIVKIKTIWLELKDYPKFLGSCDFGVSLHSSTSGIDLPMKIVDMFGCELPVLTLGFQSIGELVKDGINGKIFQNEQELAKQIIGLLSDFPSSGNSSCSELERLRKGIKTAQYGGGGESTTTTKEEGNKSWDNWETHWDKVLLPILQ